MWVASRCRNLTAPALAWSSVSFAPPSLRTLLCFDRSQPNVDVGKQTVDFLSPVTMLDIRNRQLACQRFEFLKAVLEPKQVEVG